MLSRERGLEENSFSCGFSCSIRIGFKRIVGKWDESDTKYSEERLYMI